MPELLTNHPYPLTNHSQIKTYFMYFAIAAYSCLSLKIFPPETVHALQGVGVAAQLEEYEILYGVFLRNNELKIVENPEFQTLLKGVDHGKFVLVVLIQSLCPFTVSTALGLIGIFWKISVNCADDETAGS